MRSLEDSKRIEKIKEALHRLNSLYGKGTIIQFVTDSATFESGKAVCKMQYGRANANWKVENNTVYYRLHQQKI